VSAGNVPYSQDHGMAIQLSIHKPDIMWCAFPPLVWVKVAVAVNGAFYRLVNASRVPVLFGNCKKDKIKEKQQVNSMLLVWLAS